jgi:hypothetical protein
MQTQEQNLCRALSGVKGLDFELRRNIDDGMFAASVFCQSASDIGSIMEAYGELMRKDTKVFLRRGRKRRLIGELSDVINCKDISLPGTDTGEYDIPIVLEDKVDDETELDTSDLLDVVDLSDRSEKSRRFYESAVYEDVFAKREELGLSIDYYKTKKGNSQFRYRLRQKVGSAGRWVSKDYVRDAVNGLKRYDAFVAKGDWQSLRKAEDIADRYFTQEGKTKSREKISQLLDKKAVSLSCYAAGGLLDENTAKQVYSRLVMTRNVENVMCAVEIAKRYLPNEIVRATEKHLDKVYEEEYSRMGVVCLSNNAADEKRQVIPPANPDCERQFFFLAA